VPESSGRLDRVNPVSVPLSDANFVLVKLNSVPVKVLVDSGATRSCISAKFLSRLRLTPTPLDSQIPDDVFTANNTSMRILGQVELSVYLDGLIVPFTFIVLPTLFHDCIIGTDFLLKSRAKIDFRDRFVSFYDDLAILPLLSLQPPSSLLRLAEALTVPPCTEALAKVVLHKRYKPQLSIVEALPTLSRRKLALARSLVNPSRSFCVCRLLNPTNSPISLPANTAIATIEPIDVNDHDNRRLLNRRRFIPPTYVNSISAQSTKLQPEMTHEQRYKALQAIGLPLEKDKLSDTEYEALVKLLFDNKDIFATSLKDLPGTDLVMHTIETTTETPIRQRQYRHPPHLEAEIEKQCQKLYEAGIIQPSESPWNSPAFLIKKRNNEYRFVLDYRKLNAITVPKFYPLPTLENCLDLVG